MRPLSPPAKTMRPSLRTVPECAMSSTPNRFIVLMAFRVLELKICMREPVVTANKSCAETVSLAGGGGGNEMCVTGDECPLGSSCSCDEKESQYFCSWDTEVGALGSLTGCSGWTWAAIAAGLWRGSDDEGATAGNAVASASPNFFGGATQSVLAAAQLASKRAHIIFHHASRHRLSLVAWEPLYNCALHLALVMPSSLLLFSLLGRGQSLSYNFVRCLSAEHGDIS